MGHCRPHRRGPFPNEYGESERYATLHRWLRIVGVALVVDMFAIYRHTPSFGLSSHKGPWIDFSYPEILGLIGYTYLELLSFPSPSTLDMGTTRVFHGADYIQRSDSRKMDQLPSACPVLPLAVQQWGHGRHYLCRHRHLGDLPRRASLAVTGQKDLLASCLAFCS